jgi:hypothetical protein
MRKLSSLIAAMALAVTLTSAVDHAEAGGGAEIPSVPEAWSPEGRAPYTPPPVPEAWSPEGQAPAS